MRVFVGAVLKLKSQFLEFGKSCPRDWGVVVLNPEVIDWHAQFDSD